MRSLTVAGEKTERVEDEMQPVALLTLWGVVITRARLKISAVKGPPRKIPHVSKMFRADVCVGPPSISEHASLARGYEFKEIVRSRHITCSRKELKTQHLEGLQEAS